MPSIDTLVTDILKLFDGHKFDPENLSRFSGTIESVLTRRFGEYGEDRKPYLRLSNVGKPLRQLWFELRSGLKGEALSPSTKMKFLYGDLLEAVLIALAIEAGHTVTDLQKEVEIDGVVGSIDCLVDGVLVDVKSASTYSYKKFNDGLLRQDDPFGYIGQLSGYSTALGGLDGAFLVLDKTLGHLCLARFSKEELNEYNVRRRIVEARTALDRSVPPVDLCYQPIRDGVTEKAPDGNGNEYLPVGCSYCSWKHHCHPGLRTFAYSFGPRFFTKITKEPRVNEVRN